MLAGALVALTLLQGPAPNATCVDIAGRTVIPLARKASGQPKATVLIFYLAHCPISQKFTPEINRIHKEFSAKGVQFYLVHEDLTLTNKEVAAEAKAFGLKPPVVIDKWRAQMKVSGAKTSPEAVLYDENLRLRYRGRINDLFYGLGKMRPKVTSHDLRNAISDVLAGKTFPIRQTEAVGCILPKI